jgi:gluconate 2-dehydrogenase subunit 3-like protein
VAGPRPVARPPAGTPDRFPGFDAVSQARHWDEITAAAVLSRLGPPPALRFFGPAEEAIATALLDLLLGQAEPAGRTLLGTGGAERAGGAGELPRVPVTAMIDARLAEAETDGWRYADMPEDGQAWRDTLGYLEADAQAKFGRGFAACPVAGQAALIQAVQDLGSADWHGLPASRVWSLWTRYACTAFYAHPTAWNEIGFPGPAYPRGYKNLGAGRREPFEVADTEPADDPVRSAPRPDGRADGQRP